VEEAERWADDARSKIRTKRRTVEDAVEEFRAEMDKRVERGELRQETARNAENALRKLHATVLEAPLSVLTERKCAELYNALVDEGGAAGTQHRFLRTAKTFGDWLARRRWAKANPWQHVERVGKRDDSRDVVLRTDEAALYRDTALEMARGGDTSALAALLLLVCGLSPIEVSQVEARDVDQGGRVLWIAGARLKTRNRRRNMDVLDEDVATLLVKVAGNTPAGPIFKCGRHGVTPAVRRVAQAAGIKQAVNAQVVRRSFATLAAKRGASLDAISYSLGHGNDSSAATARSYYVQPGAVQSGAARRVLGVLDGGASKRRAK
jgi:site-specific recombinase XerD